MRASTLADKMTKEEYSSMVTLIKCVLTLSVVYCILYCDLKLICEIQHVVLY